MLVQCFYVFLSIMYCTYSTQYSKTRFVIDLELFIDLIYSLNAVQNKALSNSVIRQKKVFVQF